MLVGASLLVLTVCFAICAETAPDGRRGDMPDSTTPPPDECQRPADIVFLLDASNSIWQPHFRKQIQFVTDFIRSFDIGFNRTRVGVVTYGSFASLQFHLYHYGNARTMAIVLNRVRQSGSRNTNTGQALDYMRSTMFKESNGDRPDVINIGIVITDGASQDPRETARQARLARAQGIHLFAIGVGDRSKINVTELVSIASAPKQNYVFEVDDADSLESIRHLLKQRTCKVSDRTPMPTLGTTTPRPSTQKPTTVKPTTEAPKPTARATEKQTTPPPSSTKEESSKPTTPVSTTKKPDVPTKPQSTPQAAQDGKDGVSNTTAGANMPAKPKDGTEGNTTGTMPLPTDASGVTKKPDPSKDLPDLISGKQPDSADRKHGGKDILPSMQDDQNVPSGTAQPRKACGNNVKVDVMFVMSDNASSNKTKMALRFFSKLTALLDVEDDKVRVGLVPSQCEDLPGLRLDSYYSGDSIQKQFQLMEPKTDDIANKLRYLRTQSYSDCEGHRKGVHKVAVVVVDKEADDLCDAVLQANAARRDGIEIFVVAVGDDKVKDLAREIASVPVEDRVFRVALHQQLPDISVKVWTKMEEHCKEEA